MSPNETLAKGNRVLAALAPKEASRLLRLLTPVNLSFGQILYQPGKTIGEVYFPVNCLISLLTAVDRRRTLEVGMVGKEGMAGMPFVLGVGISGVKALVQGAGQALMVGAAPFRREFGRNPALQQALYRYTHALMAQISQTAACNCFHDGQSRLARWLLMTRDRVASSNFQLTHEFLAHMLGLRRAGVTLAAEALKRKGLITYSRGIIRIDDPKGLQKASCSCYAAVNTMVKHAERDSAD